MTATELFRFNHTAVPLEGIAITLNVKETTMHHIRAPPSMVAHSYAIRTNSNRTMKGQHTRPGVLPSLYSPAWERK